MTAVEFLVYETERAYKALLDRAKKVPPDKLEWKPLDHGRSVLDMCQECAHGLLWTVPLVRDRKFEMTPETMAEYQEARSKWQTLDEIENAMHERFEKFKKFVTAIPETELQKKIELPWGQWTVLEAVALPSWNLHYHTGQINYIQTLYGDKEM